ncbi:unnamed protein product [Adineta steineri]|uniref:NAD(P)(+)--arginine ADP-ribosyltransferase n=1 Tax=Adineta steineri TaxID=433720 RepID=A0A815LGS7_9BILA|nr:unnamed protein product [Adineta steineri]CAF1617113.1 unnamed protein product [Adineta steineri]
MYVQPVGQIRNFEKLKNSESYNDEVVENYLERAVLYMNERTLREKRDEYAIIEDDFGPMLEKKLANGITPSFGTLKKACEQLDRNSDQHYKKSMETYTYFTKRGISKDEAKACAMAIAFYSGGYSALVSTSANYVCRMERKVAELYTDEEKLNSDALMVMYYLIKGLSRIDFYWGVVTRYVNLDKEDAKDYKPGEILTWLQFSSADKGGDNMTHFTGRNTVFKITSLTGRAIQYFSNCAEEEDEVLFLPHSSFLVCRVVEREPQRQIFLRQIELGLSKYVILWVDDNIFDENWGNKQLMEKATTLGTSVNVHFIPKSNTDSALSFLRSEFGQRLKDRESFRIVTDMKRTNEDDPSMAGVRLLMEVRNLGFKQSCLIFTGHEESSHKKLQKMFGTDRPQGITVTQYDSELEKFVLFKRC